MNIQYTTPSIPAIWRLSNIARQQGTQYFDIQSNPKLFSSSENIINYTFLNAINSGTHNKTRLGLNVFSSVSLLGSIKLKNSFGTLQIFPSDLPTINHFFRNSGLTSPTNRARIAESIAFELRSNLTFDALYNIYAQGAIIFIEARNFGAAYNFDITELNAQLTIMGGVNVSTNVVATNKFKFQDLIDASTYFEIYVADGIYGETINKQNSILCDVYTTKQNTVDNFAINISDSIKQFVDIVLPTKRTSPTIVVKELDKQPNKLPVCRPFYILYGSEFRFASGLDTKKMVGGISDVRFVLNSAFGYLDEYDLAPYILDANSTQTFKFLTNCPNIKETDYNSHEYLNFYKKVNNTELGNLGLEVEFEFYDETTTTNLYPIGLYSTLGGVLSIDISPDVLRVSNIEAVNAKLVKNYKVRVFWTITGSTKYYSEYKTYTMKRICHVKTNNIIFLNEFGVFDSLNFTGEEQKNVERNSDFLDRAISIENPNFGFDTVSDEVVISQNLQVSNKYTITSQLFDKDFYNYLSNFLKTSTIFIYSQEYSRYKAIKIENYEYNYSSDLEENLFVLTYSYSTDENTITR